MEIRLDAHPLLEKEFVGPHELPEEHLISRDVHALHHALRVAQPETPPGRRLVEGEHREGLDRHRVVVVTSARGHHGRHHEVDELPVRREHRAVVDDPPELRSPFELLDDGPGQGRMQGSRIPILALSEIDEACQAQARSERKSIYQ